MKILIILLFILIQFLITQSNEEKTLKFNLTHDSIQQQDSLRDTITEPPPHLP